jgi:hypothetical protein
MAGPAQQLDVTATLTPKPSVGPMMHGHGRRTAAGSGRTGDRSSRTTTTAARQTGDPTYSP